MLKTIYEEAHERIAIIIMHRFNGIVLKATNIVVLENGSIKETGTHQELLAQKGLYYKLFITQKDLGGQKKHDMIPNEQLIRRAMKNILPSEVKIGVEDNLFDYLSEMDIKFLIEIIEEETGKQLYERVSHTNNLTIKILMNQLEMCD